MITIIHGDNLTKIREHFLEVKSSMKNPTMLEGENITLENLAEFFSGNNLFFEEKNLIIENLLSKNKKGKNLDEIVNLLNKNSRETDILLREEKEVSKKATDQFLKAKIYEYKIPKIIFNFLDGISPGNGVALVKLFHELLKNTSIEIILYMLVRQLRILIALSSKEKSSESIDELRKLAPWQHGKLERQVRLFGESKLIRLYNKLFKIDIASKTGKLNMPLPAAIDMLLLDI